MGTVEVAREAGPSGCLVAVKRLLPELASDRKTRELFLREARVAALLKHPNVVRTCDFGEDGGGPFLVMDYVEGVPLSALLVAARQQGEPIPPRLAAHIMAEVCEGLHAAHELRGLGGEPLNLVHRDVSPQNVMLARDGRVLLLDFGVAKIDASAGLTKTGEVRGKTAYMSPEQGMGERLDRRSDLFAVGSILYECVRGTRMWGEGTELDVLRKLALEEAPRLDGPSKLAELHKRLVAKVRRERPASAKEAAESLRAFALEGVPMDLAAELRRTVERLAGDLLRARSSELASAVAKESEGDARAVGQDAVAPVQALLAAPGSRRSLWPVAAIAAFGFGALALLVQTGAPAAPAASPSPSPSPSLSPSPSGLGGLAIPLGASSAAPAPVMSAAAPPARALLPSPLPVRSGLRVRAPRPPSVAAASAPPTPSSAPSSKPLDVDPHPF